MKLADILRGLLRRWYIVVPGLLLAVAVAVAGWMLIRPGYERTATVLLLPGEQSMPEGGNPYIFLGGLSQAADVLVRAAGADAVVSELTADYPGVEVEVKRDGSTAGPVILIKVTASADGDAEAVLGDMVASTESILNDLQDSEGIEADNQILVTPITIDSESTLDQRDRLIASVGGGLAVAAAAVVLAGLVDGLMVQRRRRGTAGDGDGQTDESELMDDPAPDAEAQVADDVLATAVEEPTEDELRGLIDEVAEQDVTRASGPRRRGR